MTNEEFDRRMTDITERQDRNERKHDAWRIEMEDLLTRLARVTKEGFRDTQEKINALINAQIRTEEAQRQTAEQQRITDEQLRRTDELVRLFLRRKPNGQKRG